MEKTVAKKQPKFSPPKETVLVEPIMRARNPLVGDNKDHEAYFLFGTAKIEYSVPIDRQGNLINPFESEAERAWLEDMLDLDFNIYRKDCILWRHKVKLGKEQRKLNLENPKDYLDYIVLRTNKLFIAPNAESMYKRATYRYALVSEGYQVRALAKRAGTKKEAYKGAAKLETQGREAMIDFLKVYGKKVSEASKTEFLVTQIDEIIEKDIEGFLALYNDQENYEIRLLLENAVEAGVVNKNGRKYYLPGGDPLCGEGEAPTITATIEYLKSPANQDIFDMITARVNNAKE